MRSQRLGHNWLSLSLSHGYAGSCKSEKVAQSCLTLCIPHGLYSPRNSPGQNTGMGILSPRDLPNPGIEPRSPTLQVDSLPAEPQRKPKNTGVGSLSLLQRIFPTQKSSQGLLYCRWILYQLSYQGTINFTTVQLSVNQMEMDRGPIFINCQL